MSSQLYDITIQTRRYGKYDMLFATRAHTHTIHNYTRECFPSAIASWILALVGK